MCVNLQTKYVGTQSPANSASTLDVFIYAIPYIVTIVICLILALVFFKKSKK